MYTPNLWTSVMDCKIYNKFSNNYI